MSLLYGCDLTVRVLDGGRVTIEFCRDWPPTNPALWHYPCKAVQ